MKTIASLVVTLLFASSTYAQDVDTVNTDATPEFAQLARPYFVKIDSLKLPQSMTTDYFLGDFRRLYRSEFSEKDAEKIDFHWQNWMNNLRLIINTSNAYTYIRLQEFEGLKEADFDAEMLRKYADAFDEIEQDHEQRIMEQHERLMNSLSPSGSKRMRELISGDVTIKLRQMLDSGAMVQSKFDMHAFIKAHPDVMAKQAALEMELAQKSGPPKELVFTNKVIDLEGTDAKLGVIKLVPKSEEQGEVGEER